MYRIRVSRITVLFVLFVSNPADGAIPRTIPFQAVVKTAGGTPVSTPTPFIFRLYSSASAPVAEALWTETKILAPQGGLLSTSLGESTPLSLPFDAAYWVGIQMGSDSEMTPRVPLGAVPYALVAAGIPDGSVTAAKLAPGILDAWNLGGNAGTVAGTQFVGTSDNQALEIKVNGQRAMRYEPTDQAPNLIGGHSGNYVKAGAIGGVIAGGGEPYTVLANIIYDNYSVIAGGSVNRAGSDNALTDDSGYATVSGGTNNTASGLSATSPGGFSDTAAGQMSFAAGRRAKANHDGVFVWGDSTNADIASAVAGLPMNTWNYVSQPETTRHMGPMAQDFAAAFGVGEDDKHISTIDADGVALAAIQGLYQVVQTKDARIAELERSNAEMNARLLRLERLMEEKGRK